MSGTPRVWTVVPAAGRGARFAASDPAVAAVLAAAGVAPDTPKQYAPLKAATVIGWAVRALLDEPRVAGIVVVVSAGDARWPSIAARLESRKLCTAVGGVNRQDSVLNGLQFLNDRAAADDWALVHDAARPCLCRGDLARLLDALESGAPGSDIGAVLAAPIVDTVKRERDGVIGETVERHGLWRALTPQVFRFAALTQALRAAQAHGVTVTDEAQAMERAGRRGLLVAGSPFNIKVTRAEDLALASRILDLGE